MSGPNREHMRASARQAHNMAAVRAAYDVLDMAVGDLENDDYLYADEARRSLELIYETLDNERLIRTILDG